MKQYFIISIFFLASCTKEAGPETPLYDKIAGTWEQEAMPHSIYHFSDGRCEQRIHVANGTVWINEYWYSTTGNQLSMTDTESETKKLYSVEFSGNDEMTMSDGTFKMTLTRYE